VKEHEGCLPELRLFKLTIQDILFLSTLTLVINVDIGSALPLP
jgi:hypothetical protein